MTLKISRSKVSTQPNPTQPMDGPNPWPTLGWWEAWRPRRCNE